MDARIETFPFFPWCDSPDCEFREFLDRVCPECGKHVYIGRADRGQDYDHWKETHGG